MPNPDEDNDSERKKLSAGIKHTSDDEDLPPTKRSEFPKKSVGFSPNDTEYLVPRDQDNIDARLSQDYKEKGAEKARLNQTYNYMKSIINNTDHEHHAVFANPQHPHHEIFKKEFKTIKDKLREFKEKNMDIEANAIIKESKALNGDPTANRKDYVRRIEAERANKEYGIQKPPTNIGR